MHSKLQLGKWNVVCDICGFEFKNTELQKDWRGLMVCKKDFEHRNPQDFLRVSPERIVPPWTRPEPENVFVYPVSCTLQGSQGLAGIGVAGCMISGRNTPY